jgi:hypothetical protein
LLRLHQKQLHWLQASLVLQQRQVLQLQPVQQRVLQVPQQEVLLVELQEVPEDQLAAHRLLQVQTPLLIAPKAWISKKKMAMMK